MAPDGPVTILCGKGNNGGDGLVVARMLRDSGREVNVVCVAAPEELTGDARANLERLPGPGPAGPRRGPVDRARASVPAPRQPNPGSCCARRSCWGARRWWSTRCSAPAFRESPAARWRARSPRWRRPAPAVLSVDVPSGVDASTGEVAAAAVQAAVTVTFHAAKPGLWINPGKAHAGTVEVADIGIPRGAPGASRIGLISESLLAELPRRGAQLDQVQLRARAAWRAARGG